MGAAFLNAGVLSAGIWSMGWLAGSLAFSVSALRHWPLSIQVRGRTYSASSLE